MKVAVLGAGSWGTTLALLLGSRGHQVRLWARSAAVARGLAAERENRAYLPGHPLPPSLLVAADLAESLDAVEMLIAAVPIQHLRQTLAAAAPHVGPGTWRLGAAKGIERITLLRQSQVLSEIWGPGPYAALSGPSFAEEVARGEPTALTVASLDHDLARRMQTAMATSRFRVYTSEDVAGVELAGALKNVIAIAAGMVRGLGFGSNTLAALLTRGLAEVRRLGVALGGRHETFLGLAGMGDLLLTGSSPQSRNFRVGEQVAAGRDLGKVLHDLHMVAEGVETARSAEALASRTGVEMPITSEVVQVLFHGRDPRLAVQRLMARDLKHEEGIR